MKEFIGHCCFHAATPSVIDACSSVEQLGLNCKAKQSVLRMAATLGV